jgi:hypothetical protein
MSFCEHCQGQRFDRARVLRALKQLRKDLQFAGGVSADAALLKAMDSVRRLEIPHLEPYEEEFDQVVH